jgi:excisionase family DNA binding protein
MTQWLTVREAAEYLRVSERTMRDAVKLGYVPAYSIGTGREYRLAAEDLDEWMLSRSWEPKQYL